MAISHLPAHQGLQLDTDAGVCDLWIQDGRTAYVRAGLDDRELIDAARGPLDIGRGVLLAIRVHLKFREGEWRVMEGFRHASRVDQGRDKEPTGAQLRRASNAITDALNAADGAGVVAELRREAQAEANEQDAKVRDATAVRLELIAAHLRSEAAALRNGGRVSHREVSFGSGYSARVDQVMHADGTLMDPCPMPPTIYGASEHRADSFRTNVERD